jgi:hypothetical protein
VLLLKAGAVEVVAVFDADEVGHLNGFEETAAMAGHDAGGFTGEQRNELVGGHVFLAVERIGVHPRHGH